MTKDRRYTKVLEEQNSDLNNVIVFIEISADGKSYTNYMVFKRYKYLNLQKAKIKVKVKDKTISLVSDKPALGVFIETENDVILSDNALTMQPGKIYDIKCSEAPGEIEIMDVQKLINYG